jgi:hypothetical protein
VGGAPIASSGAALSRGAAHFAIGVTEHERLLTGEKKQQEQQQQQEKKT